MRRLGTRRRLLGRLAPRARLLGRCAAKAIPRPLIPGIPLLLARVGIISTRCLLPTPRCIVGGGLEVFVEIELLLSLLLSLGQVVRRGLSHGLAYIGQLLLRFGVFPFGDVNRSVKRACGIAIGGILRRSTCLLDELDVPFVLGNGLLILAYPRKAPSATQHGLHVMRVNSQCRRAFLHGLAVFFQCHETGRSIAVEYGMQTAPGILILQSIVIVGRSIIVDGQA
mmetsp:Transcript_34574/g.62216  ORF Transcript_34574/g.62216 Transcript_34574/m.62216 type:complete len:225 (+) Transcript_34574:510-1184(+)